MSGIPVEYRLRLNVTGFDPYPIEEPGPLPDGDGGKKNKPVKEPIAMPENVFENAEALEPVGGSLVDLSLQSLVTKAHFGRGAMLKLSAGGGLFFSHMKPDQIAVNYEEGAYRQKKKTLVDNEGDKTSFGVEGTAEATTGFNVLGIGKHPRLYLAPRASVDLRFGFNATSDLKSVDGGVMTRELIFSAGMGLVAPIRLEELNSNEETRFLIFQVGADFMRASWNNDLTYSVTGDHMFYVSASFLHNEL